MRRSAKIDANQNDIVNALRRAGATVQSLAANGQGVPDLLVGFKGQTFLFEIKDGAKPLSARKLTPDQVEWHKAWRGGPLVVVESAEQALSVVGLT